MQTSAAGKMNDFVDMTGYKGQAISLLAQNAMTVFWEDCVAGTNDAVFWGGDTMMMDVFSYLTTTTTTCV